MKAVLVIEMPERCFDCPCYDYTSYCRANDRDMEKEKRDETIFHGIASWCPLKPMPNKIIERGKWISEEYQKGWNAFREALGVAE